MTVLAIIFDVIWCALHFAFFIYLLRNWKKIPQVKRDDFYLIKTVLITVCLAICGFFSLKVGLSGLLEVLGPRSGWAWLPVPAHGFSYVVFGSNLLLATLIIVVNLMRRGLQN